jgi:hypothetical protein
MVERGLADLLTIMRDQQVKMRDRINAAVSASRVSALAMPGEPDPPALAFLRWVIDYKRDGIQFPHSWRREAAAAISFWERKCKRAELLYQVPDQSEHRESWRRLINGALRYHLGRNDMWPGRKDILLAPGDDFQPPAGVDPETVFAALTLPAGNRQARRRQKAIDERMASVWNGTEEQRITLLKPLAVLMRQRLMEFGLAD